MRSIDNYVNGENKSGYDGSGINPNGLYTRPPVIPTLPPAPVPVPTTIQTGGPLPPTPVVRTMTTGGPLPPTPVQTVSTPTTGGPLPPTPVVTTPRTGGPLPPTPVQPQPIDLTQQFGPAQTVEDMLNHFINGQYAQNARQRGLETAASRGLLNSNIAAGASQRAALEAVQPFVSEGMGLLNNREQRALTQNESALERQFREKLQNDSVLQQDWLANNAYNREFNGNLSLIPIANSMEMLKYLFQKGAEDPQVFTPNIMNGMQNFFTNSMLQLLQQFFPNTPTGGNS